MSKFSRVYKSLDQAQTWKVGDRIMHNKKAASNVDMNDIRDFRDARASKSNVTVLKTNKQGKPISINKDGVVYHKRSDGDWYSD